MRNEWIYQFRESWRVCESPSQKICLCPLVPNILDLRPSIGNQETLFHPWNGQGWSVMGRGFLTPCQDPHQADLFHILCFFSWWSGTYRRCLDYLLLRVHVSFSGGHMTESTRPAKSALVLSGWQVPRASGLVTPVSLFPTPAGASDFSLQTPKTFQLPAVFFPNLKNLNIFFKNIVDNIVIVSYGDRW